MTGYVLRPALTTDAGRVGEILSDFIDETPWMPRIHTRAEDLSFAGGLIDRGWVTVVEDTRGVVGFAAREGVEIHALYIDTNARGAGYGSALMKHHKAQAEALSLWTFEENAAAQVFYRAHGFSETARTGGENEERLPDIRFEWRRTGP